jgi:hypothetical protein
LFLKEFTKVILVKNSCCNFRVIVNNANILNSCTIVQYFVRIFLIFMYFRSAGVHYNEKGQMAIYAQDSEMYKKLSSDAGIKVLKAMKSSR